MKFCRSSSEQPLRFNIRTYFFGQWPICRSDSQHGVDARKVRWTSRAHDSGTRLGDHLEGQHAGWNCETERFCCFQIEHELVGRSAGFSPHQAPHDFLNDEPICRPAWITNNPPFVKASEFTLRALDLVSDGMAMLVRTTWIGTLGCCEKLFRDRPPAIYAPLVERVPMVKERWDTTYVILPLRE
jgi:hypothetical protein